VLDVVNLSDDEGVMRLHLAQEAGRRELGSWTSGRTNSRMVGTTPELDNTCLTLQSWFKREIKGIKDSCCARVSLDRNAEVDHRIASLPR
jgi:hypothetical protein